MEEARPISVERPVVVIDKGAVEDLPYDLWQPGYCLHLSIHQYFPNLVYPVLQALNPAQLERLASCPQPAAPLGRQQTIQYLLKRVFGADPALLSQPYQFIAWLLKYHQSQSALPPLLLNTLLEQLAQYKSYAAWNSV